MSNHSIATRAGNITQKIIVLACGVVVPQLALAGPSKAEPTELPLGAMACQSRSSAEFFAQAEENAPDFAAEMLARAMCYKVQAPTEALVMGREGPYTRYKLLSGHIVWVKTSQK